MKNFFSQVEHWEVWLFLICALILGTHFGRQIDFENIFKKDSPVPVHMGGTIQPTTPLSKVAVVNIPNEIYDTLPQDSKYERYLTGNHKYILLFTYDGCPYARAYHHAFKHAFEKLEFAEYYRKRIINVGRVVSVGCPVGLMDCASLWVTRQCLGKICIFNPQRKQVVVDNSQNAEQLPKLLEKYKEW